MDERTNKLIDTFKKQGSLSTGAIGDVFATTPTNQPITSETLGSNETPLNLPEVTPSTSAAGLSAFASSVGEQEKERAKLQAEQDAKVAEEQAGVKEEKGKIQSVMDKILGVPAEQAKLEKEAGIGEKAQRVTTYTNQLESLERAEVNELRALQTANMTDVGRAAASRDIQRKYVFQKADVALLQSAANRDLETAQNIINRKIQLLIEPLKMELDFVRSFYEENKQDLTKQEDRQFQLKLSELDRTYEEQKNLETYKGNITMTAIENGVPIPSYIQSELNRATSLSEVNQILAKNGISLAKPVISGGGAVDSTVQTYADLLAQGKISLSNVPQNIRNAVVAASEGVINKPLSDTAIKEITQTESALANLQSLKTIIQNNLQFVGPVSGIQRFNPWSEARQVQAEVDRVRQVVGKALEGGVLRKEDEEKYKKILSTLADTPETAIYKIDSLTGQLQRDLENYRATQALAGKFIGESATIPSQEDLRTKYNY